MSEALHVIGQIAAYIAVLIVVYLLYMAIVPILSFSVYFQWWNKWSSGMGDPASCFDMLSLAYYEKFMLYYRLRTQLLPAESAFANPSWAILIKSIMFGGAIEYTTNSNAPSDGSYADFYYVYPKDLCISIVPAEAQDTAQISSVIGQDNFPSGSERGKWQDLILSWAGVDSNSDEWNDFLAGTGSKNYGELVSASTWSSSKNNFLFTKYQIPVDSPVVIAYVTNFAMYNGDTMYPALLQFLLGGGTGSGGWWGFCQAGGEFGGRGYAEISRQLWADEVVSQYSNPSAHSDGCGGASAIGTIALTAVTTGALALMAPVTGGASIALAAGLATAGGVAGAAQAGCF